MRATSLYILLSIILIGCKEPIIKNVIYKPNAYEEGYVLEVPIPFDYYVSVGQPDRHFDYFFIIENGDEALFISNNIYYGNQFLDNAQDTIVEEGMDDIRRYKWVNEDTIIHRYNRYWKTVYILKDQRHQNPDLFSNGGISAITYGYFNVKRKNKKIYDTLINNITNLKDTTIVVDSIAVLLDL